MIVVLAVVSAVFRSIRDIETKEVLYKMIEKCTGQDMDQVIKDCDRDNFIKADKAVAYGKYGLVDKVIEKRK